MCAHVVRLRWRGVVHIAPDVAVVPPAFNFLNRYKPGVALDILSLAVGMNHLRDVFRTKEVLRLALAILSVGIDEEDVLAGSGVFLVRHQHASRNTRTVEEPC